MSQTATDWSMFALGLCGLVAAVWLHRSGQTAVRARGGLGSQTLAGFAVIAGCLMGLEGLLEFHGTVGWQAMTLGFVGGGGCGVLAGRSWISRHPRSQAPSPADRVPRSGWSWRFVALLLLATLAVATVPILAHAAAPITVQSKLQAAVQQGLAGLFLVFGLLLALQGHSISG